MKKATRVVLHEWFSMVWVAIFVVSALVWVQTTADNDGSAETLAAADSSDSVSVCE
jgi:hypothetical protein